MTDNGQYSNILHVHVRKYEEGTSSNEEFVIVAKNDKLRVYGKFSSKRGFEEIKLGDYSWNFHGRGGDVEVYRPLKHQKDAFLKEKGLTELLGEKV